MEAIGLSDRVAAGESIAVTRRGKPVARLTAVPAQRKPVDAADALADTTRALPCAAARVRERRGR